MLTFSQAFKVVAMLCLLTDKEPELSLFKAETLNKAHPT